MLAAEFEFDLPNELIAQYPAKPREQSRLMVVDRARGRITDHRFTELPALLNSRDILARNNSLVIPARLIGRREATGGTWEGLLLRDLGDETWEILATTRGKPAPESRSSSARDSPLYRVPGGSWALDRSTITRQERDLHSGALGLLERHGLTPLPPYIRKGRETDGDRTSYQTIFAHRPGSIAAPTAGLHFSEAIFHELAARGISWVDLTLHVGIGTFRSIEAEDIDNHIMHSEWAELSPCAASALWARRAAGGRIVAIGTTSARTLETAAAEGNGRIIPFMGNTSMFIQPGHVFRGLDCASHELSLTEKQLACPGKRFGWSRADP